MNSSTATRRITSMAYGGQTMAFIISAFDTVTEPGTTEVWYLSSNIPTGQQDIVAQIPSGGTDTIWFNCGSVYNNRGYDMTVQSASGYGNDRVNPQYTLPTGSDLCMGFCGVYSGLAAPTSLTVLANMTFGLSADFGPNCARTDRQTSASTANFTIGYTAASDDVAFVAFNVKAVIP